LWTAAVNAFTDRTDGELAQLLGWKGAATNSRGHGSGTFLYQLGKGRQLPKAFMKWTKLESSTNIKNQGSCGS